VVPEPADNSGGGEGEGGKGGGQNTPLLHVCLQDCLYSDRRERVITVYVDLEREV
jgi:hypothetical protein